MMSVLPEEEQALFDVYLAILNKASLEKEVITAIKTSLSMGACSFVVGY